VLAAAVGPDFFGVPGPDDLDAQPRTIAEHRELSRRDRETARWARAYDVGEHLTKMDPFELLEVSDETVLEWTRAKLPEVR